MKAKADPKPAKRVKNPDVYKQFHKQDHECWHCGSRNVSAAHLLGGRDREDVLDGLIPLCGGGTTGCHGAWHGNPYRGDFGVRVTPERVRASVARVLRHESGEDQVRYLKKRLGEFGCEAFVLKLEGEL